MLSSGLIDGSRGKEMVEHSEDYIESLECFSWERFFTKLLVKETEGTYMQYSKSGLNPVYLNDKEKKAIADCMDKVKGIIKTE